MSQDPQPPKYQDLKIKLAEPILAEARRTKGGIPTRVNSDSWVIASVSDWLLEHAGKETGIKRQSNRGKQLTTLVLTPETVQQLHAERKRRGGVRQGPTIRAIVESAILAHLSK
ncbi:MAG: hypothetical protein SFV23_25935 [Planctomycetaceae bacterium]|nr:hypothetical protein [Planctomycetaceae bacterium]